MQTLQFVQQCLVSSTMAHLKSGGRTIGISSLKWRRRIRDAPSIRWARSMGEIRSTLEAVWSESVLPMVGENWQWDLKSNGKSKDYWQVWLADSRCNSQLSDEFGIM